MAGPEVPLAVDSYAGMPDLADGDGRLNLAWTSDEGRLLDVDLAEVVAGQLRAEAADGLPWVGTYFVKDPYGAAALGPSVAAHFSLGSPAWSLTCGAGVGSLVRCLAALAAGGTAYVAGDIYPDFPHWVAASGGRCVAGPTGLGAADHVAAAAAAGAAVVFVERPPLTGDHLADPSELAALADGAAGSGAVLVVDESNANYRAPGFSAVALVAAGAPMVVLRGLSKGYGLGGLRLGWCVAPPGLADRVRSVVPPLLASSLSLRVGRAVLDMGDVGAPLRRRVAEAREEAGGLLASAGVEGLLPASPGLPYLLVADGVVEARSRLEAAGVVGKLHPHWSGADGRVRHVLRLSAPLVPQRMERLRLALSPG